MALPVTPVTTLWRDLRDEVRRQYRGGRVLARGRRRRRRGQDRVRRRARRGVRRGRLDRVPLVDRRVPPPAVGALRARPQGPRGLLPRLLRLPDLPARADRPVPRGVADRRARSDSSSRRSIVARDAPVESAWVAAPRDAVLIVDGIFLHRPELRDLWDWSVWLDVPYEVAYARMALRDGSDPDPDAPSNARYRQGQQLYLRRGGPAGRGIRHRRQRRPRAPAPRPPGRPLMAAAGILLVDKPGGMTSHDVVARARRALGTRKIGHAGTLDPMATGLLILGVEGATRLLTFIVGLDKTYEATIRLGVATDTDDAEGVETARADAAALAAVTPEQHRRGRRRPHRADLAGAEHRVGDQGRRPPRVRPRPRGRRGRAQGPRGDRVAVRGPRRASDGRSPSTSTSSSTARAAPTSARWRGTSAPRSASAGT